MTTEIEPTIEKEIGKSNYEMINDIVSDLSLDLFVDNRKKGSIFSCCFILKNILIPTGKKADVFIHRQYESVTRNKYKDVFDELILFEEIDDDILDKINNFNKCNENKVFYIEIENAKDYVKYSV